MLRIHTNRTVFCLGLLVFDRSTVTQFQDPVLSVATFVSISDIYTVVKLVLLLARSYEVQYRVNIPVHGVHNKFHENLQVLKWQLYAHTIVQHKAPFSYSLNEADVNQSLRCEGNVSISRTAREKKVWSWVTFKYGILLSNDKALRHQNIRRRKLKRNAGMKNEGKRERKLPLNNYATY